ncbi:MAG: PH domain-containing protein [Streptosporangiales bacterium]|nr:PH domain-containing protein [Streptosporangiales bacterium]
MSSTTHDVVEAEREWHRLDPRMLALNISVLAAPLAGFGVTAIVTGGNVPPGVFFSLLSVGAIFVVMMGVGLMRYATTRYRIGEERVELHAGLVFHRRLSIPRDRIRSVDLTANPLHRIFGLSVVKVGTGQNTTSADRSGELSLDAVRRERAEELRLELLRRSPVAATPVSGDTADDEPAARTTSPTEAPAAATGATAAETTIATMNWAWIRYAPLTGWTLVVAAIIVGGAGRVLDWTGVDPYESGLIMAVFTWVRQFSLVVVILVALAAVLVVGVIGATLIFIEGWWGFRLVRESGGSFRVRRGLLTTRSLSLEERRLRGVELVEGLGVRLAKGATTKAIAAGLATTSKDKNKEKDFLLPPAPREEAYRVSAEVLAEETTPLAVTGLARHPRAALRRRLFRAIVPVLLLAAVLAVVRSAVSWMGWLPSWVPPVSLLLLLATIPLAFDAYRNLGHTLAGRYLLARHGTVARHTVALRRTGIIGWTVSRTFFQRRSGLATIAATTGAGSGAYRVYDVDESTGLTFAEQAVPDLLTPFLERDGG